MVLPYDNMDYGEDQVGARNIPELNDVELTNLANGEILKYNSSNNKWENQPDNDGAETIDNLTDTNISNLQDAQYLRYNSSNDKWENFTLVITDTDNLVDLTDTNISSVANGEILKYNSSSSKWENNNLLINDIQDVNITSLQHGEVLKYNSEGGKWENQDNTDNLNELTDVDVDLTESSTNQVLKYNGSIWVNNFVNLTELADTNITTLNNGDILRYNSVSQKWETDTFNINDLDNVNITSVANNEVLKYNSSSGKWENSDRIDTLNELGDVTLTSVTTGDLLRYNGTNFVNTKIALDNDFTNVNFTSLTNGDLIKYNGSNFINFAPTYLDGAGISDNYLIKVVGGVTTQTNMIETSISNTSTSLKISIPSTPFSIFSGAIETEIFDTIKRRMHLTTNGIQGTNGITITSDGRVGIGIVEPEEDLEIDGSIQIDSANVSRLKFQKSGQNPHALGEIDGEEDGTNGGDLQFYTKVVDGSVTEKLRINNAGAIGIGGANYGNSNQVIVSKGSGNPVEWADQTDTTYTQGTGVTISPTNVISIGQQVGTGDNPTFNQLTLGNGNINLQDFANGGNDDTIAQIKGGSLGTGGGKFQIFVKDYLGNLEERFLLQSSVAVFKGNGLNVNTSDNTQQAQIYNSLGGDKDMTLDAYSSVTDKGISFITSTTNRMRIKKNGNVGINKTDPTYRLHVVGDIKGDNLILGEYGETPKIDMLYTQGSFGVGYDKRITIGVVDDFPNTTGYPAHPPTGSMGINIQNNSDGLFIGIEEYATGEYRPLLKWGDDEEDTPFTITNSFNNKKFEFGVDGRLSVPGLIKGESGTVCKIHILPFTDAETANVSSNAFTDTVGKTFTKTAGTNLFGEVHINYTISGYGSDSFQARLNFFNNPGITGGEYDILNDSNVGGGGRSGDINGAAVYTDGTGTTNSGSQGIYLQARRNGADDTITFKAGFFKVTEIWA